MRTLTETEAALAMGHVTARQLLEECLAAIQNPAGEGRAAFIRVESEAARRHADAIDVLRALGRAPGRYAGLPISIKDLFDIAGQTTAAGSRILAHAPPPAAHAVVVQRMLAAGFVPIGRTNMTEFAYSGLGLNPHYGTPLGPFERNMRRVPGGSSSGAAVSVADGMALAAIGTDTGGSCRIPAAFCGIVGFKPTARRVPLDGVLPLSPSLDSVGPLASSVRCCAIVDAVLAGQEPGPVAPLPVAGLRLAAPTNMVLDGMDRVVAAAFERALRLLSDAGARITPTVFPQFEQVAQTYERGGIASAEAYACHRGWLDRAREYDPRVLLRIERGAALSSADYLDLLAARRAIIASMNQATAPFDAVVMPTVALVPPRIDELHDDRAYGRINALVLRNTSLGNFLDRCAISLPCHRPGEAPAGLMLMGETDGDSRLFAAAAGVEAVLGG